MRFEDKVAVALVGAFASGSMIAGILDPASFVQNAPILFPLTGLYIFLNSDPAIVINFYSKFFRIAWNSIL